MNNNDEAAYYLSRADEEEQAARQTTNSIAADIHRNLASRYRARARNFPATDKLSVVRD